MYVASRRAFLIVCGSAEKAGAYISLSINQCPGRPNVGRDSVWLSWPNAGWTKECPLIASD